MIATEPSAPAKLAQVRAIAFEGGGINGLAYAPVIEALEDWGIEPDHLAGASAGAITAMLWALGYRAQHLRAIMPETPWDRFTRYRPGALWRLLRHGGFYPSDFAREWIRERVIEAGFAGDMTFRRLLEERGKRLYVAVTRYGKGQARPMVLDADSAPDTPIATAVLASMAVPVVWSPVLVGEHWHCDGGVAMNHPLSVFEGWPPEQILGVRLDSGDEIHGGGEPEPYRPGLIGIVRGLVPMMRELANRAHVPEELWERIVRIDVSGSSALDFGVDEERLRRLEGRGRAALEYWVGVGLDSFTPHSGRPAMPPKNLGQRTAPRVR